MAPREIYWVVVACFMPLLIDPTAPATAFTSVQTVCTVQLSIENSITFQWLPFASVARYGFVDEDKNVFSDTKFTTETTITIDSLVANTRYNFILQLIDRDGQVMSSTKCSGFTEPTNSPCRQVTSTTPTDSVTFQWPNIATAARYTLNGDDVTVTTSSSDTSVTVSDISSTTKKVTITAYASDDSVVSTIICNGAIAAIPCYVQSSTSYTITFQWPPSTSVVSYDLSDPVTENTLYSTSSTSLTIENLLPGSSYSYKFFRFLTRPKAMRDCCYGITAPGIPDECEVVWIQSRSIKFQWQPVENATKYTLVNEDGHTVSIVRSTSAIVTDLAAGQFHSFALLAFNINGFHSDVNTTCSAVTAPYFMPNNSCYVQSSTTHSITFRWSPVHSAANYLIHNQRGTLKSRTSSTSATISKLSPGVYHTYTLRAVGNNGIYSDNSIECAGATVRRYRFCKYRWFRKKFTSWCMNHLCRRVRFYEFNPLKRMRCLKFFRAST